MIILFKGEFMNEPTLQVRIGCAVFIALMGVDGTGVGTQRKLMWPHTEYDDDDVKRVAAKLLASVHTAVIATLPPEQIEQISTTLSEYLSLVACIE